MKQLFLTVLVVIFGLSSCCAIQAAPQEPKSDQAPVVVVPTSLPSVDQPVSEAPRTSQPAPKGPRPEGCAEIEVNYDLKWAEIAGGYEWAYPAISDMVLRGKPRAADRVTREVCWFKFDHATSSEVARERIEASGRFLVAEVWELNALGTAKPDLQSMSPLVALGSLWRDPRGDVRYPVLGEGGDKRNLLLRWVGPGDGWSGRCRFVAVSK